MFFHKCLSSPRNTRLFMICCGILIGAIIPGYTSLFFGAKAFTPLYSIGCVAAGLSIGFFCHQIFKQSLKLHLEHSWHDLNRLTGEQEGLAPLYGGETIEQLLECNAALMNRAIEMSENLSGLSADISARDERRTAEFRLTVTGNEKQTLKGKETIKAVGEMNAFFHDLLKGIEDIAARTGERASISTEMSATTDATAQNIRDYSSLVLETSVSIEEMALSIKETASNIDALTASTEQTYNSINRIGTSIANVRDNAQRTSECSEKVRAQAQEGMEAMTATIAAMHDIEKNSDYSVDAIKRLSIHSLRVGEFLKIIKDVVAQTNLLSLNASIIAAQAGERGKSFAVVAEEVRALAQRTSASTSEIEELVKNIQKETVRAENAVTQGKEKVAEGVRISERADEALHRIEESAAESCRMVQKIAAATDEQALGSRMITEEAEKNLARVKQVTRAIQEEENGAGLIVKGLEHMRGLSRKITTSTEEQARGNRLYMRSVLEDNDKVKQLRDTCIQQIMMSDVLRNDVTELGLLIEANTGEVTRILDGELLLELHQPA
jgi:methyl-accepting chemotaxis protein